MLCVTAAETTAHKTEQRILDSREICHEIRLDFSHEIPAHLRLIRGLAKSHRLLVTCRPVREHGGYDGPEAKRIALLESALEAGAWAVDLEWDSPRRDLERLADRFSRDRIVVSAHIWDPLGPESLAQLRQRATAMADLPARWAKLAIPVEDVADLAAFFELPGLVGDKDLVLAPMGRAGRIGRIRYRRLRSAWTYVAASNKTSTAPGQVDLETARSLRMEEETHLLALIGGPSVQDSPGPVVYNEWLAEQLLPFQYLAAETARFPEALALLRRLGLVGASVTMPHKKTALEIADEVHPQARAIGAANTLSHASIPAAGSKRAQGPDPSGPEGWQALNTDVYGIRQALEAAGKLDGKQALVLGAGGAAAAAVFAIQGLGAEVTLVVREPAKARALADRFSVSLAPWDRLDQLPFDLLANATPVGRDGRSLPIDPARLQGKVVFDMLLRPHPSPLVRAAEKARAALVRAGLHMWVAQGRAQLRRWTGQAPDQDWLTRRTDEVLRSQP